jgi:hypothetical protein
MKPSIGIYQPFYKPELVERLDDGFTALNWLSNPAPALREFALHRYIAQQKIYKRHQLSGVLSPKFFSKTGLLSSQIYSWLEDNPGRDLYLVNGMPFLPYQHFNGVERNYTQNPEFERHFRSLCAAIGFELPEEFPRQTNADFCGCSYWIGSPGFWEKWHADVIAPIGEIIDGDAETNELLAYYSYPAPTPVCVLTMLYERLVNYYVLQNKVKALYYPWTPKSILSLQCHPALRTYLEEMIPLVDGIDARGRWSEQEKNWLRERCTAVRQEIGINSEFSGFGPAETLSSDLTDFDLPRRYPRRA